MVAPSQPIAPLLLNVAQAAQTLAISQRTLWALTKEGKIPSVRFGKTIRYATADLVAWIEAQKHSLPTVDRK